MIKPISAIPPIITYYKEQQERMKQLRETKKLQKEVTEKRFEKIFQNHLNEYI